MESDIGLELGVQGSPLSRTAIKVFIVIDDMGQKVKEFFKGYVPAGVLVRNVKKEGASVLEPGRVCCISLWGYTAATTPAECVLRL